MNRPQIRRSAGKEAQFKRVSFAGCFCFGPLHEEAIIRETAANHRVDVCLVLLRSIGLFRWLLSG
jgi:hypothetical protein